MYTDKLSQVAKHEFYSRSAKQPQLSCKQPSEVLFDYVFTRLFKTLESEWTRTLILWHLFLVMKLLFLSNKTYKANTSFSDDVVKALSPEDENEPSDKQKKATLDQHNNIVAQYKELIREQVCNNRIHNAIELIACCFFSLVYLILDTNDFHFRMHS